MLINVNLRRNTMNRHMCRIMCILVMVFLLCPAILTAQEQKPVQLPEPQITGGKPLMEALKDRQTIRTFSSEKLPVQMMSNLLWAAFGINRPDSGRRTAPSAVNWQEIDIYVTTEDGVYLYDASQNMLQPVLAKDIRAMTGTQPFVGDAALNLVYVADYSKMGGNNDEGRARTSMADTGFIGQNVYLFCASEGLATVVRVWSTGKRSP